MTALAEESFRRALAIDPELSLAHYLYAQLEMETGRSLEAFDRLLGRARERRADPQIFTALVQSCRYVGLLRASRAAHERAKRLDPGVKTSIAFTSFMAGDYAQAVADARAKRGPAGGGRASGPRSDRRSGARPRDDLARGWHKRDLGDILRNAAGLRARRYSVCGVTR